MIYSKNPFSRTKSVVNLFSNFIGENEKVIDVGAGSCHIAKYIQENKKVKVVPIDVVDYNQTDLNLIVYDGKKIPFGDSSFDTALLIFVLHHADNLIDLLKEVKRASKNKIIILEDTPANKFERLINKIWDWSLNIGHGVNIPFNFQKREKWHKIFKELGLEIIYEKELRSIFPTFGMVRQTLFVVKK